MRLTRKGTVFLIDYFSSKEEAEAARKSAEERYAAGRKFPYLHAYNTKSNPVDLDADDYLFSLSYHLDSKSEERDKVLYIAVLIQAVKDLLHPTNRDLRKDARQWFNGKCESPSGFSFLEIIELLDLPEQTVRLCLKRACRRRKESLRKIGRRLVRTAQGGELS